MDSLTALLRIREKQREHREREREKEREREEREGEKPFSLIKIKGSQEWIDSQITWEIKERKEQDHDIW